ncbi:MAG: riboflavin synthase subunit alpha [Syntrophobacterales bacterium RBG_19FT_COMBO_59_10]|nr:MAG: riboflavin synthase subunit alpha [Syntrophobacterales bacterium RBG_19FT_COMBO_59_10]
MFTGIVAAMGIVRRLTRRGEDALLEIDTSLDLGEVRIGDSIAVSGVCLTVTKKAGGAFQTDVSAETLSLTTLKTATAGDRVNLEPALLVGGRLGGHIVLGHVDCVGRILEKTPRSGSVVFGFEIDPQLDRYIVAKGSIAVDGISLTVNRCEKNRFHVNIIPHTAAETTLGFKKASDAVNIETDILARHVEKLIFAGRKTESAGAGKAVSAGGVDLDKLARYGFIK